MSRFNKEKAFSLMQDIMEARLALISLPYPNVQDVAKIMGATTAELYKLYKEETGRAWTEDMPYHVIIREANMFEKYYKRGDFGKGKMDDEVKATRVQKLEAKRIRNEKARKARDRAKRKLAKFEANVI